MKLAMHSFKPITDMIDPGKEIRVDVAGTPPHLPLPPHKEEHQGYLPHQIHHHLHHNQGSPVMGGKREDTPSPVDDTLVDSDGEPHMSMGLDSPGSHKHAGGSKYSLVYSFAGFE